ncbi:hypothetical protein M8J76_007523 [Diaphorina citri]|nr:hypothetical protein M8J75_008858 [Diaphorina citri]KAI5740820.1 hypothetical protein M8J76_007523 [Diaphorina citri]KAI5747659.1 hypothetical protein M8J77_017211 [Diaphorina citri]
MAIRFTTLLLVAVACFLVAIVTVQAQYGRGGYGGMGMGRGGYGRMMGGYGNMGRGGGYGGMGRGGYGRMMGYGK